MARYPTDRRAKGFERTDKNAAYRRFMAARMAGQSQEQAVAAAKENLKGGPTEVQAQQITEKFPPATPVPENTALDPRQDETVPQTGVATDEPTPIADDPAPIAPQPEAVEAPEAQEDVLLSEKPESVGYADIPNDELEGYDIEVLRKVYIAVALETPDGRWKRPSLIKAIKFERQRKAKELARVEAAIKVKGNGRSKS